MSKCDEYRMKMDEIEDKIRQLEPGPMDWLGDLEREETPSDRGSSTSVR